MAVHALTPAIVPANAILGAIDTVLGRSIVAAEGGDPLAQILTLAALMPRPDIEAAIDAMIEALDASDGDPDIEDGDDDCCAAGDDDPARSDCSIHGDDDRDLDTWEHHGERQPNVIHSNGRADDEEPDGLQARRRHRDRIRRTRCRPVGRTGTFATPDGRLFRQVTL